MPSFTVAQLAALCGGEAEGDTARLITGANTVEQATASDVSFAESAKSFSAAAHAKAGCLITPLEFNLETPGALIRVPHPRAAFAQLLRELYPPRTQSAVVHPTAVIALSAVIGNNCAIGAYATIAENTRIDHGCTIEAGCRIGADVVIGADTTLHANVTLYDRVHLGSRVILHSGCVIGADGFGYTFLDGHFEKFPQVGTVEIGDDVELGANCCVDRAALGVTRIREGSKIDNLVHVGHNCDIGRNVVIAAQTGISGSVTIGDYAMIGGQTGIGEKAKIDPKSVVGGKAGILTSQHIEAGEPVWGIPARPLKQHLRGLAHVSRLPKTQHDLKQIKKRLNELEAMAEHPTSKPNTESDPPS